MLFHKNVIISVFFSVDIQAAEMDQWEHLPSYLRRGKVIEHRHTPAPLEAGQFVEYSSTSYNKTFKGVVLEKVEVP